MATIISETIRKLPPELCEIIYKEYLAIKLRQRAALGWNEVHEALRASSYDPGNRAGSVTGMNFVVCSYGKFQPGYRDEIQETKPKWRNINKYCSRLS